MADGKIDDGALEGGLRAVFGEATGRSVLGRLEEKSGRSLGVILRDDASPDGPLVRPSPGPRRDATERYQLAGEIARGGIGVILKGRDVDLGREVALKVLHDRHRDDPEIVQRFVEEAQIGGQLQHPGIVPVHELGMDTEGRPFIAMKLVKGQTLAALLTRRESPADDLRRLVAVFEKVCQTVAYAHARGVIHRDLKPSNIMVGAFGEVQVVDWGLAKVLGHGGVEDERRATRARNVTIVETVRSGGTGSDSLAGSVMGTPEYMPPEQAQGRVDDLDERSDVFALGAILTEILTGHPPYVGDRQRLLGLAGEAKQADALARLDACGADPELVDLAKRCLLPRQAARPVDAGEVARTVADWLAETEERARRAAEDAAEARGRAATEKRVRRLSMALAATVLVAVLVGGGAFFVSERDRRVRAEEVSRALEAASLRRGEVRREADPESWTDVVVEAERILELVRASGTEGEVRDRAEDFLAAVRGEAAAAREEAARAERMRATVHELRELRLWRGGRVDPADVDAGFARALGALGVTPGRDAAETVAAIRGSGIAAEIVAALDRWISVRTEANLGSASELRWLVDVASTADGDPWRERVRRLAFQGDPVGLRELWTNARAEALEVESLRLLANALGRGGDPERAVEILAEARRRDVSDPFVAVDLAGWAAAGDPPDAARAVRLLAGALAILPESAAIHALVGDALQAQGDGGGAGDHWASALELAPGKYGPLAERIGDLAVSQTKAWSILRRGFPPLDLLRKAAARLPDRTDVQYQLGAVCAGLDDWTGAREALERAARLAPDRGETLPWMLGLARYMTGDREAAHEVWARAIADGVAVGLYPSCASVNRLSGARAIVKENPDVPREAAAWFVLGSAIRPTAETLEASVEPLREAASLAPRWEAPRIALAQAFAGLGRLDEARVAVADAARLCPDSALPLYVEGSLLASGGDPVDALARWREALALDGPDLPALRSFLVRVYGTSSDLRGDPSQARALFLLARYIDNVSLGISEERIERLRAATAREILARGLGELDPEYLHDVPGECVHWLLEAGDPARAVDLALKAVDWQPQDARRHLLLAQVRLLCPDPSFRDAEEGLAAARRAAALYDGAGLRGVSTQATTRGLVALAHCRLGRIEEAVAIYEEVRVLTPTSILVRALVLAKEGRPKEAEELLGKFRRNWPFIASVSWVVAELEKEVSQALGHVD